MKKLIWNGATLTINGKPKVIENLPIFVEAMKQHDRKLDENNLFTGRIHDHWTKDDNEYVCTIDLA